LHPSSSHCVKYEPSGTFTDVVPPKTIEPELAAAHVVFPSFSCSHPPGQDKHSFWREKRKKKKKKK
jgi:hypothetical protein